MLLIDRPALDYEGDPYKGCTEHCAWCNLPCFENKGHSGHHACPLHS